MTIAIGMIDPKSGEIGFGAITAAGGPRCDMTQFATIVPGRGLMIAIATAILDQRLREFGVGRIQRGQTPQEILAELEKRDPQLWFGLEEGIQTREYGILTLPGPGQMPLIEGFCGRRTVPYRGIIKGDNWIVLVNMARQGVLEATCRAVRAGAHMLMIDRILSALDVAASKGGDRRTDYTLHVDSNKTTYRLGGISGIVQIAQPGDQIDHPSINVVVNSPRDTLTANATVAVAKQLLFRRCKVRGGREESAVYQLRKELARQVATAREARRMAVNQPPHWV